MVGGGFDPGTPRGGGLSSHYFHRRHLLRPHPGRRARNRKHQADRPPASHPVIDRTAARRTMRLWTLHPRYLDAKGLVAAWREALLAQKVIAGGTRGYTRHPQLVRFRDHPRPDAVIAAFLRGLAVEAAQRGYRD